MLCACQDAETSRRGPGQSSATGQWGLYSAAMEHTRPLHWLVIALAFGACGRTASEQDAGVSVPLNLPFDPVAGCRENSSATCSECCIPSGGVGGNGGCTIYRTNSAEFTAAVDCPSTCAPCARCSEAAEKSLANAAQHVRPDCDCATIDPGIDPCFTPEGCGCFCVGLTSNLNACPQLGTTTCGHGNRCGVGLVAAPGPYHTGDQVQALWINFDSRTAFLDACGSVGLRSGGRGGTTIVPPAPCPTAGATVALAQGQSAPAAVTVATPSTSQATVFGTYYLDCQNGAPFDPSTCSAGPLQVEQSILLAP
jgi:hypothetical protein